MSGETAMGVTPGTGRLPGCSDHETQACRAFALTLVRSAGTVLVGEKPAALFSFFSGCPRAACCSHGCVSSVIHTFARALPAHGVRLEILGSREGRFSLLAWRPRLVGEILRDQARTAFLAAAGYDTSGAEALVASFSRRLAAYYAGQTRSFPHEVGILLGYPLEDVLGFMGGGEETYRGQWRVFGDADAARRRFERLEQAERLCRARYAAGETLASLIA